MRNRHEATIVKKLFVIHSLLLNASVNVKELLAAVSELKDMLHSAQTNGML
jgi:hypothetical protein